MQTYQTWECSEEAKVKKVLTWPFIIRLHDMKPGSLGSLGGFLSRATGAPYFLVEKENTGLDGRL